MNLEVKAIADQLKKLNQNFERYLRMIDFPRKSPIEEIKGVLKVDPEAKYIFIFSKDTILDEEILQLQAQLDQFLGKNKIFLMGGVEPQTIEVKE